MCLISDPMRSRAIFLGLGVALLPILVAAGCHKTDPAAAGSQKGQGQARPGAPGTPPAPNPALPPQSPAELSEVVAVIDSDKITVADFQNRINAQSPYVRARYTSLEQKKDFLDNWIRFEVLAREAKKRGFDQDPEVVATMKQVMIQKLMKEQFEHTVKPEDITEAEMKKFYGEHLSEYNKPEEVRVSAVVVKSKETADKVAKEARAKPAQDNLGFRELVDKYSEDADSKAHQGDLRFFARDAKDPPPEVIKAAFALKDMGEVGGPVGTAKGYYVLKQTGRRAEIKKSYEDVKRQIQNRIYRDKRTQAMTDFVENLKKQAKITVNQDVLGKVRVDTTTPPPMTPPGEPGESPGPGAMAAPGQPQAPQQQ
jgi:parvulin-like peptidyl-prolyl isomerase